MTPDIFKKDWFDGRTIEAISSDDSKRIGWDEQLSNYSEFLFDEGYLERLLNDKELIVEELEKILTAMDVAANVGFSGTANTAYTDGNKIVIDNKFVPDHKIKIADKVYNKFDILIGLLIHEACHCKYTDFEYCDKNRNLLNPIIHSIHNILEDECIERNIGLGFPGYSNFIKAVKLELFKRQLKKNDMTWNIDELQDIFNLLLITVRYPEKLNIVPADVLEQHSELFEKIRDILDFKGLLKREENLDCTRDTVSAAIAIFNLLNINENDMGKSDKSGKSGKGTKLKKSEKENSNSDKEKSDESDGGTENSEDDKNGSNKEQSDNDSEESEPETTGKISMGDALDSLEKSAINAADSENIDSSSEIVNEAQRIAIEKKLTYDDTEGTGKFGWGGGLGVNETIKQMGKSNVLTYNKLYGDIKQFINDFKKIIVPTSSDDQYNKIEFQRSGQLDPNQIVNALHGGRFVNTRMQRTVIKKKPKYALVLNLDESSSMFGTYCGRQIRIAKSSPYGIASRLAVLFYEAMKDYADLEIYIYGHGDNINRYIFHGQKNDKYVLGNRQLQGGQNDSVSIDKILEEVRSHTQLPIIMVNITDSLYLSGIDDMKKVTDKYGDVAFTLMCVAQISKKYMTEEHIQTNNKIYGEGNWVCIDDKTNLKQIATQLAKVFKSQYKLRDRA